MTTIVPWIIGVAVLFLAAFIVYKQIIQRQSKHASKKPGDFAQETSEELAPVQIKYTEPSAHKEPELHLPQAYGFDRMVLMVRDPDWLYAYWEITATKQEEFYHNLGFNAWENSHPVLRVYDVTGVCFNGENANSYLDISVNDDADSWHINVGKANCSFCVDIGRKLSDGRFITLLRSNVVTTPRVALSECLDEEWMWIEGIYRYMGKWKYGLSSAALLEQLGPTGGIIPSGVSSPGFHQENPKH
ncbi:conserved hypothetical protein [Desulfofarcimen acetoxidans DSM 771]|jgi:hypothetical protein|uniref:DUF4912 domain-containing protein n=1 Tax=Desulfofarcimen acetoxidans (strain ATCC 49208 / DSM 771 / KCTC 5769 / VKM B-1644 / 5575) TaxID=485916 RepID=C8W246_DESAS|nr:DUF4912 domain-containing protein [Desulfofarcimen acetoxidans]ACV61710.1 conserved hypothetical protein [Desulfofarcimen acetoxidans DSM 771]